MATRHTSHSATLLMLLLTSLFSPLAFSATKTLTLLAQDSPPKYFFVEGQLKGLCVDIYHALEKKLAKKQIAVEYATQFTPIKRIFSLVETEPQNVFCGAAKNKSREQHFNFSTTPVYPVNYVLATHVDNTNPPKTLADLEQSTVTIGALYGTSSAREMKLHLGENRVNDSFTDFEVALKLLSTPPYRLKYFYYHDIGLNYMVQNSGLPLKVLPVKFTSKQHWLIYSKQLAPDVAQALNIALTELQKDGSLKRIIQRYAQQP